MNCTESTLVRQLDEYHETSRRGQAEISKTLKKVDENLQKMNENQTRITELLMQVTHRGKDPDTYGKKEAGGSGGTHEEDNITRRKHQDPKEVLEVAHSMGRWVAGPIIGHTCQCSQMNR
jgi:hypothetical protein